MFIINGTDYTLIALGVISAVLFFTVQLTLCQKAKRMAIKLIPAYIIFLFALLVVADLLGVFGSGSGFISVQGIIAMTLSIVAGIALIGEIAAWVVYGIHKRKSKRTL